MLGQAGQEMHPCIDSQNPRAFLISVSEEQLGLTALAGINTNRVSQRVWITWGSYSLSVGRQHAVRNAHITPR